MDDRVLLGLFGTEPNQAMKILIDRYGGLVYTVIYGKIKTVGTREDAEECTSDVFSDFYAGIRKFDPEKSSLKTFLCMIALRKAVSLFRKLEKESEMTVEKDKYDIIEEVPDDLGDPLAECERSDTRKRLLKAVKELGEPDSTVIVMRFYLGYKDEAIGKKLGLSKDAVRKRAKRSLEKLKIIIGGNE